LRLEFGAELITLKASDVDFDNHLIHVQRTLSRGKIKAPKNGRTRLVDIVGSNG
jgi:integrase